MTSTSGPSSISPDQRLVEVHRREWGRLLALLVARTRRLDLVEDALAEAFATAAARWPVDGTPDNPAAWLYTVAHRNVLGRLRHEAVAGRTAPLLAVTPGWVPPPEVDDRLADERLHLILLCCHPALRPESRSALALRLVVGTPTDQIARLFLVPTATMAARLTRAKKKIVGAGIPLGAPAADELRARVEEVCRTIYLAFTAGYAPGPGPDLHRADVAGEAVALAAVLHDLAPDEPAVPALRALLLLQHARRDAREVGGKLVTLGDQDRTRWHRDEIRAGLDRVAGLAPTDGYGEELRLQALVAAAHGRATTAEDTDWLAIADAYAELEARTGSAVVRLNRAVAVAEVDGPQVALRLLDELDGPLGGDHRLAAVRGALLRRAGATAAAAAAYRQAIEGCGNEVERAHLQAELRSLNGRA